ncbi:MAG: LexA family transcriptional regulator [bacterium]|nr:LexA family transcriptional regulator [bacterium]
MENKKIPQTSAKQGDLPNVIAFHAGTDWSSQMHLNLNEHLVTHPSATFFLRVKGDSPEHGAIRNDDILIVDRALTPSPDSMVVAVIDGALVIVPYRQLESDQRQGGTSVKPGNPLASAETAVWGVITYAIHKI